MLLLRTGFVASTGRLLPVHRPDQGVREAGWSGHRWTTYDNPYMAEQWAGEIAELKAARPLVVETPWFRQMYLGEWVSTRTSWSIDSTPIGTPSLSCPPSMPGSGTTCSGWTSGTTTRRPLRCAPTTTTRRPCTC